jgi:hypothetical protein
VIGVRLHMDHAFADRRSQIDVEPITRSAARRW